jgi:hypothetical protein
MVLKVFNLKAVMIGSRSFRLAADIQFDNKQIKEDIMEEY